MIFPKHRLIDATAWLLAAISSLLFIASVTGDGQGLFGLGLLSAPGWSWAFLAAISIGTLTILILRAPRENPRRGRSP